MEVVVLRITQRPLQRKWTVIKSGAVLWWLALAPCTWQCLYASLQVALISVWLSLRVVRLKKSRIKLSSECRRLNALTKIWIWSLGASLQLPTACQRRTGWVQGTRFTVCYSAHEIRKSVFRLLNKLSVIDDQPLLHWEKNAVNLSFLFYNMAQIPKIGSLLNTAQSSTCLNSKHSKLTELSELHRHTRGISCFSSPLTAEARLKCMYWIFIKPCVISQGVGLYRYIIRMQPALFLELWFTHNPGLLGHSQPTAAAYQSLLKELSGSDTSRRQDALSWNLLAAWSLMCLS